jgi:microcystin-dependent protein
VVNRVQTIRYYTTLQRPPTTEFSGELYINFADIQIGALNPSKSPVDFVAVRYYSQTALYVAGDFTVYNGSLYRCIENTVVGPFDNTRWSYYADSQEVNVLIAVETANRQVADQNLQNEINAEIAARQAADQNLQNEINALNATIAATNVFPTGASLDYYGVNPPTGWLLEDGSVYNISTYPALGALLGNRYGGDGAVTFAVPNSSGRFGVATGSSFPLGTYGGSTSAVLNLTNLPSHTHTIQPHTHTSAAHHHATGPANYGVVSSGIGIAPGTGGAGATDISTLNTGDAFPTINPSAVLTSDATGGATPINILPPYISRTRIIKT